MHFVCLSVTSENTRRQSSNQVTAYRQLQPARHCQEVKEKVKYEMQQSDEKTTHSVFHRKIHVQLSQQSPLKLTKLV